ncbi:hypothetical protein NECAME_06605 [Necator americanus]|uniref:Uncharacterized protein n=1 Tax=Necator americanus TaxID=51031 RepID=W2TTE0_NECAM|nr:hypothetical protein NECAME_06605 [Necator americanus]ETN85058.1 hypothetical protein NECAME_06605 [Necator americanus]
MEPAQIYACSESLHNKRWLSTERRTRKRKRSSLVTAVDAVCGSRSRDRSSSSSRLIAQLGKFHRFIETFKNSSEAEFVEEVERLNGSSCPATYVPLLGWVRFA